MPENAKEKPLINVPESKRAKAVKKLGVEEKIKELCTKASENGDVLYLAEVHEKLIECFCPEKDVASLMSTLKRQVPCGLKDQFIFNRLSKDIFTIAKRQIV